MIVLWSLLALVLALGPPLLISKMARRAKPMSRGTPVELDDGRLLRMDMVPAQRFCDKEIERAREDYANDLIELDEFERRMTLALEDPDGEGVRLETLKAEAAVNAAHPEWDQKVVTATGNIFIGYNARRKWSHY